MDALLLQSIMQMLGGYLDMITKMLQSQCNENNEAIVVRIALIACIVDNSST